MANIDEDQSSKSSGRVDPRRCREERSRCPGMDGVSLKQFTIFCDPRGARESVDAAIYGDECSVNADAELEVRAPVTAGYTSSRRRL